MNSRIRFALLLALFLVVGLAGWSTPTASAAQDAGEQSETEQMVDDIVDRFQRLYRSVQAIDDLSEQDKRFITRLLDDVQAARVDHPDNLRLTAVATQLAIMLEDDDLVFDLFEQLQSLAPGNEQVAQDWLTYFRRSDSPERADDVIDRLVDMNVEGPAMRRTLASHLKQSMQYQRAIDYLQSIDLDPQNNPEAIVTLAECLFAEQRFQEAYDLIASIPDEVTANKPALKNKVSQNKENYQEYIELWQAEQEIRSAEAAADDLPRAELITEDGRILVELFENEAPNTVANFITLAEDDFYNGTHFHRVMTNFMAQGGDPLSKDGAEGTPGTGGPGYNIPDEHTRDDHRMHFTGSLSMAKTALPNTAGSGFYITFEPTPWLNGQHTVFGRVLEGLDVVRKIRQDDELLEVNILRKRDHDYTVEKLPLPGQTLPDDTEADADDEPSTDGESAGADDAETTEQPSGDE